jgi:predicted CoA-substrate-specific enzyme activase
MYVAGIDVGSTATKAVILNDATEIVARGIVNTGANVVKAAEKAFRAALENSGLQEYEIEYTVGTGYGRYRVPFGDAQITEISCHARGAVYLFPNTKTILDIGGQDTKGITVSASGDVVDFCMNDKCAAGTGRFLAAAADVLDLPLDEIGAVALTSTAPLRITNVCTVFVETEILSQLSRGKKVEDILAGVHSSIAQRSISLLRRIGLNAEITFTGGVSRNPGMVAALSDRLGMPINVSPDSPYNGALGAALFGHERAMARHNGKAEEVHQ